MKKQKPNIQPETPYGLTNDWREHPMPEREKVKAGPNRFAMMVGHKQFYGESYDYRVMDQKGNTGVWMPASRIAQHWLYKEIGEIQHYFTDLDGWCGVYVTDVEGFNRAAERDGLINEYDYAMEREEQDRRANDE